MSIRSQRFAKQIQSLLAEIIATEVNDPRLDNLVINEVRVTNDLREAEIFYILLVDKDDIAEVEVALRKATGLIKNKLSQRMQAKQVPDLHFRFDELPQSVDTIEELLLEASKRDKQIAELAKKAKPVAGDAPYKMNSNSGDSESINSTDGEDE